MLCDLPYKIGNCIFFNLVLYFMTNLRRTPSAFFVFLLFSFMTTLCMSTLFRCFGAMSRSLVQALVPSACIILALNIYTGFIVPPPSMVPWFRWINYVDPIGYAFEALMVNEFWDRSFSCNTFVPSGPGYGGISELSRICGVVGSKAGFAVVQGEDYLRLSFGYEKSHLWRYDNPSHLRARWLMVEQQSRFAICIPSCLPSSVPPCIRARTLQEVCGRSVSLSSRRWKEKSGFTKRHRDHEQPISVFHSRAT
jgi:ABC-type multidrug transport system permease subunit